MEPGKHIAILGGGPGGYVAAIRAAQLGGRVTIIDHQVFGGVCLNWGCIPSKALLSAVELGEKIRKAESWGVQVPGAVTYNLPQMIKRKNEVVGTLVKGITTLLKTWGITSIQGTGSLLNEHAVNVEKTDGTMTTVAADAVIIATGSSWPNLPMFPIDGQRIITSKEALDLTEVPARLLIVGGGVEGCEFAALYRGLGTQVCVIEMMPSLLPLEDQEVTGILTRELTKHGVKIYTGATVEHVAVEEGGVMATLNSHEEIQVDTVLVSVGRGFHSTGIGLDTVGVQVGSRGEILVNDRMETNVPGIYAIGDVVGKAMLAHVASAQGKVAAENIVGHPRTINYEVIPAGIFTIPEIGRVGLTEQEAHDRGLEVNIGRFRYGGLGKAHAMGEITGMFKVIAEAGSGKILGVHIMGAHAADLVHEAALAMEVGASVEKLGGMIHAHPTLSEGLMEAAEDVGGMAIHQARKRSSMK